MALNVLSLFDGISCGRVALERANILIDKYYASEIDKHAIKVSKTNYPDIIHIGDVNKLNIKDLPKIDLLIGGSPCQGFSYMGKQLNFDDPSSKLFFEFVNIKNKLIPKYFLLENVRMKKEYKNTITKYIGVEPIEINSRLFTPADRKRLYWTNIPFNLNITDKKLLLLDFLSTKNIEEVTDKFNSKNVGTLAYTRSREGVRNVLDISRCLTAGGQDMTKSSSTTIKIENKYYRLLPELQELLQGLLSGYTNMIGKGQREKCLGNGWQVDTIAHIFEGLKGRAGILDQKFRNLAYKIRKIEDLVNNHG